MGTPKKYYQYRTTAISAIPEMDTCIRLYAYSQNISISSVIRSIIRSWLNRTCMTEEILIDGIVVKAINKWNTNLFVDPFADINKFQEQWRKDLKRKLSEVTCDLILEEFNKRTMPNEKKTDTIK